MKIISDETELAV